MRQSAAKLFPYLSAGTSSREDRIADERQVDDIGQFRDRRPLGPRRKFPNDNKSRLNTRKATIFGMSTNYCVEGVTIGRKRGLVVGRLVES